MDKKIVALILVILISFCCLSIVVADNATQDDDTPPGDDSTVDGDDSDDDDTSDDDKKDTKKNTDKNKKKNKNKTDDKKGDVTAKGSGNDIIFSDGFRGFILDYSKSPASKGLYALNSYLLGYKEEDYLKEKRIEKILNGIFFFILSPKSIIA